MPPDLTDIVKQWIKAHEADDPITDSEGSRFLMPTVAQALDLAARAYAAGRRDGMEAAKKAAANTGATP